MNFSPFADKGTMCCRAKSIVAVVCLYLVVLHGVPALGQPAVPADVESLPITIEAVKGTAQVRENADAKWQKALPGMKIAIGWEIRTGLRSAIQFKIGKDHTVLVDRLGSIAVLDAIRTGGKVKTDVGLKYGRTKYVVDAVAEEHDSTVRAPSATLAIRGSDVTVSDNALFGYAAMVDHSKDVAIQARGIAQLPIVRLKEGRIEGKRPPTVAQFGEKANRPIGAALTKLAQARTGAAPKEVGGTRGGFTPVETSLTREEIRTVIAFNGDSADNTGGTAGGLTRREVQAIKQQIQNTNNPPISVNQTALNVSIQWIGQANVDLGLRDPANNLLATSTGAFGTSAVQIVRPGGPAQGNAGSDDFGTGGSGQEDIDFFSEHLSGSYTAFLRFDQNNSSQPAQVQLKVTQQDPNATLGFKVLVDVNGTLGPGNLNIAIPFGAPPVSP